MEQLKKINAWISKVLIGLMVLLFTFMILLLAIQVFGRYIFSSGFPWTEEGARYGMIWVVFFGAAYIVLNSEHVKVSLVEDMLRGVPKKVILIIQDVVSLIFVICIFVFSISQVKLASLGASANTGINNSVPYMAIPISMAICIWAYVCRLIFALKKKEEDDKEGGVQS